MVYDMDGLFNSVDIYPPSFYLIPEYSSYEVLDEPLTSISRTTITIFQLNYVRIDKLKCSLQKNTILSNWD